MFSLAFHEVENDLELDTQKLERWLIDCLQKEEASIQNYSVVFCSDSYLLDLNQQYLNHDEWTDIITFDYGSEEKVINGEAFISVDRLSENANLFETPKLNETLRLIAHGALHLIGYEDKEVEARKTMREKEELFITQYS